METGDRKMRKGELEIPIGNQLINVPEITKGEKCIYQNFAFVAVWGGGECRDNAFMSTPVHIEAMRQSWVSFSGSTHLGY